MQSQVVRSCGDDCTAGTAEAAELAALMPGRIVMKGLERVDCLRPDSADQH